MSPNVLRAPWIFDVIPDFFSPHELPEQHALWVPGPFDAQINYCFLGTLPLWGGFFHHLSLIVLFDIIVARGGKFVAEGSHQATESKRQAN